MLADIHVLVFILALALTPQGPLATSIQRLRILVAWLVVVKQKPRKTCLTTSELKLPKELPSERLGLEVVVNPPARKMTTTTRIKLPAELPSVEEALKIYAGAIKQKLRCMGLLVVV